MRQSTVLAVGALSVCLSGCVTTETPLAPNVVRLDTDAPFGSEAASQTMLRAAQLTLQNGYAYFRLIPIYWTNSGFSHVGVTVAMFQTGEAGAYGAFDAWAVLAGRRP